MPRVSIKKKDYKISDLSKYIIGEMYAQDITYEEMGFHLGTTKQSFYYKVSHNSFSYGDLLTIFQVLGTSDEEKAKLLTL